MTDSPASQFGAWVPLDVQARARATVHGMQRDVDPSYTLAAFLIDAILQHSATLEREHHDARPWPHRHTLRRGRRASPSTPGGDT